jgi:predicted small lipoprotein YifL
VKKAALVGLALCFAALFGCGGPAQTPEEAKADEVIQQSAPELQEGA